MAGSRAQLLLLLLVLLQEIALSDNRQHLDELPARARETLLSVVAAYIPYYNPPHVSSSCWHHNLLAAHHSLGAYPSAT
jgi:hypothetical protein